MAWFGKLAWAPLGLGHSLTWLGWFPVSVRLHYTAPYRFSVSMFCAPVLLYTSLGWAWVKLYPDDKFNKLKSDVIALELDK